MLDPAVKPLFDKYNTVLKPLIAEYESRNENFVTSLLIDIPDMFDNVVLFESSHQQEYLDEALRSLDNAIAVMRVCLIGSMMENIEKFKSHFPVNHLKILDGGHFYGKFNRLVKLIRNFKDVDQEKTYHLLVETEQLIDNVHPSSSAVRLLTEKKWVGYSKWIITVVIALIVNLLFFILL